MLLPGPNEGRLPRSPSQRAPRVAELVRGSSTSCCPLPLPLSHNTNRRETVSAADFIDDIAEEEEDPAEVVDDAQLGHDGYDTSDSFM